jgi:vancomycin resistance protein YoaR
MKWSRKKNLIFLCLPLAACFIAVGVVASSIFYFEKTYGDKIYPGVRIDGISFGGKTKDDVDNYFSQKNKPFKTFKITLAFESNIATISGEELAVAYDGKLGSTQAYAIGRSGQFFSDIYQKWRAATTGINLPSVLKMNTDLVDDTLSSLSSSIDIFPQDALFQFESGKVNVFKLSQPGRELDRAETKKLILAYINTLSQDAELAPQTIKIDLPVKLVSPKITTESSNNLGIKELLGVGTSKFAGSIAGRVHNIVLAASRINGHLVPPETVFSFNDTLGDVSASTGFAPAYIIKDGRTVLGDGGGVCQVSTTLFRAALKSGLPIVERHPHSYRVGYYEQDSPVGIDATVFAPSYDLKFKNDTGNYLLIQAKADAQNYTLAFEIYGTSDGRSVEITKPVISSQIAPPPDLYQDDPTLPVGTVKQVDWKAWGAKVSFDYKVTKNGETIFQKSFFTNYQPWQSVFLRGTKT